MEVHFSKLLATWEKEIQQTNKSIWSCFCTAYHYVDFCSDFLVLSFSFQCKFSAILLSLCHCTWLSQHNIHTHTIYVYWCINNNWLFCIRKFAYNQCDSNEEKKTENIFVRTVVNNFASLHFLTSHFTFFDRRIHMHEILTKDYHHTGERREQITKVHKPTNRGEKNSVYMFLLSTHNIQCQSYGVRILCWCVGSYV